jgi:hypothetical protein
MVSLTGLLIVAVHVEEQVPIIAAVAQSVYFAYGVKFAEYDVSESFPVKLFLGLYRFIVISESRQLQISSLSSPSLMKRDFKTTSTSKRPDFST